MNRFPLALVLSTLCAAASAQIVPVAFLSVPVNPVAGLPKSLPSPLSGPFAGAVVSLPSPIATPAVTLAAAPAAAPIALPAPALPAARRPLLLVAHVETLPTVAIEARRENKNNPFRSLLPDSTLRFDGASAPKSDQDVEADRESLDETFDGRPAPRPITLRREHVKSSRRHTLPEADLEAELGL